MSARAMASQRPASRRLTDAPHQHGDIGALTAAVVVQLVEHEGFFHVFGGVPSPS